MTNSILDIGPGDVVSGLEPSELVEIQRNAAFGSKKLVEGLGTQSRRVIKRPLTDAELSILVKVRGKTHTFQGETELFLLGAEAERIRIAHQFDPLFAVNGVIEWAINESRQAFAKGALLVAPNIARPQKIATSPSYLTRESLCTEPDSETINCRAASELLLLANASLLRFVIRHIGDKEKIDEPS